MTSPVGEGAGGARPPTHWGGEDVDMDNVDVDPDLARQLDAAGADEPIEAVLVLRQADSHERPPIDAESLMRRVSERGDRTDRKSVV